MNKNQIKNDADLAWVIRSFFIVIFYPFYSKQIVILIKNHGSIESLSLVITLGFICLSVYKVYQYLKKDITNWHDHLNFATARLLYAIMAFAWKPLTDHLNSQYVTQGRPKKDCIEQVYNLVSTETLGQKAKFTKATYRYNNVTQYEYLYNNEKVNPQKLYYKCH